MRGLIFGLLLASFTTPTFAGFQSQEDISKWLTFYYQTPDPARIPEAIEYMSQSGMLNKKNAIAPIFGFIAGAFKNNPDRVGEWVEMLNSVKEEHLGAVVLGLWYANLPESQALAYTMLDKHPSLNSEFAFLREGSPMSVEEIPLEQGPWVLDALWGNFLATGKKEPVERIMAALPWIDIKGNINKLMIGGAARWSLISNAVQHDRVFEFCQTSIATQPQDVIPKLREVLDNASKERREKQKGHNQSLQPTSAIMLLLG